MVSRARIFIVGIIFCILAACVTNRSSVIYYDYDHGYHTVLLGETLYSIAWRRGLDYKQLAAWNNIRAPYTIYAGQRLRLARSSATSKNYANRVKARSSKGKSRSVAKKSTLAKTNKTSVSASASKVGIPVKHEWSWPTKGKVISAYSANTGGNKGIDIAGKLGQAVLAASSGKVVYSGNGLLGYGNLIIVKHSEQFLSAYAHNKKLLVKEGGTVTRGEKIAELGSSGTRSPKLHFEIRYNGKSVNPLKYLPKN